MDKLVKLKDNSNVLFIHHWDCDGLCSAALLYQYLKENNTTKFEVIFKTPQIGNYFLTPDEFHEIRQNRPHCIFIIDMALPEKDILELKEITPVIYIFDHHKQKKIKDINHINPFISENFSSLTYPSTGWVINKYFMKPQNILSVLGAIGDQGERIQDDPEIKSIISAAGLSFKEFTEVVKLIDSYYVLNNKQEILRIVKLLIEKRNNIKSIIDEIKSDNNREKIDTKIKILACHNLEKDDINRIIIKRFKSDFAIISDLARNLSDNYPDYLIIVINQRNLSWSNIYIRRKNIKIDLSPLIPYAQSKNYNAGGKEEVVGIILPGKDTGTFLKELIDYLKILIEI